MHLEALNEQLIMALNLARIGFYDWKVKENQITFSKHMLADWGIENPESTPLEDVLKYIHSEDRDRVTQLINEAMAEHKKYSTEYRVVRPDGEIVWVEVNGIIQYDENDLPTRFFGTSINITERKLREAALAENERMIRTFLDSMPQMSFIADAEGNILHYNQRWYDYVNLSGAEGQGWKDKPIHHPDDLERTIATWSECVRTGTPYEITYRLKRYDGAFRWHLGRAFPVRDSSGKISRWYGTNTDIHNEKITIERNEILYKLGLRLSQGLSSLEVAEMILDEGKSILNASGGIVLFREEENYRILTSRNVSRKFLTDMKMLSVNTRMPARTALFNGSHIFLSGLRELHSQFPEFRPVSEEHGIRSVVALPLMSKGFAVASVAFYMEEELEFTDDVKRFLELLANQCGIAIDRAFLTEKQEFQKTELKAAVAARDEFFSIASHELKTPLTSLKLNSQVLRKKALSQSWQLPEKAISSFLDSNERSVSKLVRLVDDMLDISRIRTGKISISREEFDLNELVSELLQTKHQESKVPITYAGQGPLVGKWDRLRIEQVISNLVSNALRYGQNKPIALKLVRKNDSVLISVKDSGVGIPQSIQESIFQKYDRGNSTDVQGLGLGLYISRHIVDAHNGDIWVQSTPGEGSEFFVSLPL